MLSLKAASLVQAAKEVFEGLNVVEQKEVLQEIIRASKFMGIETTFEDSNRQTFYEFCKKEWPCMTKEFFERAHHRWELLMKYSFGDYPADESGEGELYLKAYAFSGGFNCPFDSGNGLKCGREDYFYEEYPKVCDWSEMYLLKQLNDGNIIDVKIRDLMEMNEENFNRNMQEAGYKIPE